MSANSDYASYKAIKQDAQAEFDTTSDIDENSSLFTDIGNTIGNYFEAKVVEYMTGNQDSFNKVQSKAIRTVESDLSSMTSYRYINKAGEKRVVTAEMMGAFRRMYKAAFDAIDRQAKDFADTYIDKLQIQLNKGHTIQVTPTGVTDSIGDIIVSAINAAGQETSRITLELKATSGSSAKAVKYGTMTDASLWGTATTNHNQPEIYGAFGVYVDTLAGHQIKEPDFTNNLFGPYFNQFLNDEIGPRAALQQILNKAPISKDNNNPLSGKVIVYAKKSANNVAVLIDLKKIWDALDNDIKSISIKVEKAGVATFYNNDKFRLATLGLESQSGGTADIEPKDIYFKTYLMQKLLGMGKI